MWTAKERNFLTLLGTMYIDVPHKLYMFEVEFSSYVVVHIIKE